MKPFCDLLAAKDGTLGVVLDGIANILATAEKLQEMDDGVTKAINNPPARFVERGVLLL